MSNDDRNPFSGFRTVPPPEGLSGRVLRAARDALETRRTVWDRLWQSPGLRFAWGAATVVLLTIHVALSVLPGRAPATGDKPLRARQDDAELREILSLPRTERVARALDEPMEGAGPGDENDEPSMNGDRS